MSHKLLQLLRDNAAPRNDAQPSIRTDATGDVPHIYLFGVIDEWWGASAAGLIEALAPFRGADVQLHINSPGGDVFEGRAMAAAIVAHTGRVLAHIDGLCASAATYPALSASEVAITQGGMFMIHNGWTLGYGDKTAHQATVNLLAKIDAELAADYARHANVTAEQAAAWMDAETWFTAEEALATGFVDSVSANTKRESAAANVARWNLSAYDKAPKLALPNSTTRDPGLDALVATQLQANRNRLRLVAA